METLNKSPQDTKKVFRQCGTCSQTFAYLLNREFGHANETEERAIDPLAGGIMNLGHQCGMLWGSALAIGAEAFRRQEDPEKAIALAIKATQQIIDSFLEETNTVDCRKITGYNLNSFFGLAGFMIKTMLKGMDNSLCFNLAEKWAPEAIQLASKALSEKQINFSQQPVSCASEVAKRMDATNEEMIMVAGFAGGLGLSGNACGALSAAIWMKTLAWCKDNPGKTPPYLNNPQAKKLLKVFHEVTNSEMLCSKITGQQFKTIDDHSKYIKNGGCKQLIDVLSTSDIKF